MGEDPDDALDRWEQDYRAEARADDYAELREHLRRLELPDDPELMLEGTIAIVRRHAGYSALDDRDEEFDEFLQMQKYNLQTVIGGKYVFTFSIFGRAYGRVIVETKVGVLDLADLYGSPWPDYQVVGFNRLWISHPDWSDMADEELRGLEGEITDDLRFDYSEDELDFWFDGELDQSFLFVVVQDVVDCDE